MPVVIYTKIKLNKYLRRSSRNLQEKSILDVVFVIHRENKLNKYLRRSSRNSQVNKAN